MNTKNKPKIGDCIKCHDKSELIRIMGELAKQGIFTDFCEEIGGVKGFWLVVERIEVERLVWKR